MIKIKQKKKIIMSKLESRRNNTIQEAIQKKVQKGLIGFPKESPKKPDFKKRKIYKCNEMCFNTLKEKGLFKIYKNYKHFLEVKNLC